MQTSVNERTLSRRFVIFLLIIGILIISIVMGTVAVGLWAGLQQSRSASARTLASSAQLLEKSITRSVESIDVLLSSLAYRVGENAVHYTSPNDFSSDPVLQGIAQDMMRFAPHVRQIMVFDEKGTVLFDSAPSSAVGTRIGLAVLGLTEETPHAISGGLHIGMPILGRYLGAKGQAPRGVSVVPVAYEFTFRNKDGQSNVFYAVASINPGFVQDGFDAVVNPDRGGIADEVILARYDGPALLVRNSDAVRQMPETLSVLPTILLGAISKRESGALDDFLPLSHERGNMHWQVSTRYPLVVVVGRSTKALMNGWYEDQRAVLISFPVLFALLLAALGLVLRQVLVRSRLQDRVRVLSQAIEQGPTAVLITNAHGHIEYVNQAFAATTGYDRDEVVGQTPRLVKSGFMHDDIYRDLWSSITSGGVWSGELLNRTKDGHLRWMTAAISGVRDDEGEISHYVAVETDVTERKRLDQRLAEVQKLAEGLLTLPVLLYRVSRSGIITDILGAGVEQLGLNRQSLVGRRYDEIFPGFRPQLQQALNGETVRFEGQSRFAHHSVWLEHLMVFDPARQNDPSIKHALNIDGTVSEAGLTHDEGGAIGIALDVTARRKAEAQLSATIERLNASNHELEQFAYVASHDLQEPLRIVSSYMSLLKRRYSGKLDADADEFIRYAMDGAQRMQSLILDLLQLSRIGTQGKEFTAVDLSPVVETALANLDLAIKECHASIVIADPLPTVLGDDLQLVRLFQNLIGNALKYRHPDRTPEITLRSRLDGGLWHLIVEDNGVGIGEAFRERIFLIFQRLQSREASQGNGIGLAICRKIAERHGGMVWVDGDEHKGSRFHITLRRQDDVIPEGL